MNSLTSILTAASLMIAILGALGAFAWRISRGLNKLLDLPEEVAEIVKELKGLNQRMDEVKNEARQWRMNHLIFDHRKRPRTGE